MNISNFPPTAQEIAAKAALAEAVSAFLAGYNYAAVTEINGYAAAEAAVEAKSNKWQ